MLLSLVALVAAATTPLKAQITAGPAASAALLEQRVTTLEDQVRQLNQAIEKLHQENDQLRGETRSLQQAMDYLATKEGDRYLPNIFGNMTASNAFRGEIARAIQGELVINNRTGVSQTLYINGGRWRIPNGRHSIWVPYGRVAAHLPGDGAQQFTHWRVVGRGENAHHQLVINVALPNNVPRGY
jgi:hypothetical protein